MKELNIFRWTLSSIIQVDISQVPVPPQHSKDAEGLEFEIVHHSDVEEAEGLQSKIGEEEGNQPMTPEERESVFHRLEEAIIHQIQVFQDCSSSLIHFHDAYMYVERCVEGNDETEVFFDCD